MADGFSGSNTHSTSHARHPHRNDRRAPVNSTLRQVVSDTLEARPEPPPLTLVGFSPAVSTRYQTDLRGMLLELGYLRVNAVSYQDWLLSKREPINGVMVLQVESTDCFPRMEVMASLDASQDQPVLGIIQTSRDWDMEIVKRCAEFVGWPCGSQELAMRLERVCRRWRRAAEDCGKETDAFIKLNMIGESVVFKQVLKVIKKISQWEAPVLIEGDTGTGKELAARAIHYLGGRRNYPFLPVNCGALPDNLIENELFGHEKGAYTDARNSSSGVIAQAEGGTLFLDEIETLSPKGQIALLRFLQDKQYRPLGGDRLKKADVRIITASNAPLSELAERGIFRQDLYFRLNIVSVVLPPLSQRPGDIELLADYFIKQFRRQYNQPEKHLHPQAIAWLKSYRWPGNVRELENRLHREFLLAEGPSIRIGESNSSNAGNHSPSLLPCVDTFDAGFNTAKTRAINEFEKRYLCWLMRQTNGNVTQAAKRAGKERRSLGKLLKKHGVNKDGGTIDY